MPLHRRLKVTLPTPSQPSPTLNTTLALHILMGTYNLQLAARAPISTRDIIDEGLAPFPCRGIHVSPRDCQASRRASQLNKKEQKRYEGTV
jgi:hypothetical protein